MASKRRFVSISERIRQLRPDADPELLISAGLVEVDRRQVTNPRMLVSISSSVRLKATKDLRGATKLRGALDVLALDVRDSVALDVGAAAGGFATPGWRAARLRRGHRLWAVGWIPPTEPPRDCS